MSASTPHILLSGFEPFGGMSHNPSADLARRWQGRVIEGSIVQTLVLPTCFGLASRQLHQALRRLKMQGPVPLVICTGLANDRAALSFERVARNWQSASLADNCGYAPTGESIVPSGPQLRKSTLPIDVMCKAAGARAYPVEMSDSAGTFVCNEVFYRLMQRLARPDAKGTLGGFIHLPPVPGKSEISLDGALGAAIKAALQIVPLNKAAS